MITHNLPLDATGAGRVPLDRLVGDRVEVPGDVVRLRADPERGGGSLR